MYSKPLQMAIIGCGAVTEIGHLPAASNIPNLQISLLVDKDLTRAKNLAERFLVPEISDDYHDALGKVDLALVALPNRLHAPASITLLETGISVLVEKPMATSIAECEAMMRAAERGNAILAVGLMRRFLHSTRFAKWFIEQGFFGKIVSFDFREGNVFNWPVKSGYLLQPDLAGGGVLVDTGAHTLDLLLFWLAESYSSLEYYDDNMGGVEAECLLKITMDSGIEGVVELSRTRNMRNSAMFHFEDGKMEVDLRSNRVSLYSLDGEIGMVGKGYCGANVIQLDQDFTDLFKPQLLDWIEAFKGEHPPCASGLEGSKSVEMIEECYKKRRQLNYPWRCF